MSAGPTVSNVSHKLIIARRTVTGNRALNRGDNSIPSFTTGYTSGGSDELRRVGEIAVDLSEGDITYVSRVLRAVKSEEEIVLVAAPELS